MRLIAVLNDPNWKVYLILKQICVSETNKFLNQQYSLYEKQHRILFF